MKKLLLMSMCLFVMPAMADQNEECALSPLQNLIVNARGAEEIQALIARGVAFDEQVRCGGTLMQLAIRRGNPDILEAILRQDRRRANAMVNLDAFPIPGAPKDVPLLLFAAYYAPNKTILELLLAAGAKSNVTATDEVGRNVLWYLNKNPVLRKTDLEDKLNEMLLYGGAVEQNTDEDQSVISKKGQDKTDSSAKSQQTKAAKKDVQLRSREKKKSPLDDLGFLVDE